MKYLTIDYIKAHCRIDFDCEDAELELYGQGAEDTILYLCNRTFENLIGTYGEVPASIIHVTIELVCNSYEHRSPASPQNLSAVPYNFDLLVNEYIVLAGTPLINERNRIIDAIQDEYTNICFFAADDESETKKELTDRMTTMVNKFASFDKPTPMILENMRQQLATLQADVKTYLESHNQA